MVAKFYENYETGYVWQTDEFSYRYSSDINWGTSGHVITAPSGDRAEITADGRWGSHRVIVGDHDDQVDITGCSYAGQQSGFHDVHLHGGNDVAKVMGGEESSWKTAVWGGDGNDYLIGRNASLLGGDGNDYLISRNGFMSGGEGWDTFVAIAGANEVTVADYRHGVDRLAVMGASTDSLFITRNFYGTYIHSGSDTLFRLAWYQGFVDLSQVASENHSWASNV